MATKAGTKENPWKLKTPPGTSEFEAYKDETSDPPALVVQVGSTQLRYRLCCIEDLRAMLEAHGDWMLLGSADEQKPSSTRFRGEQTAQACAKACSQYLWLLGLRSFFIGSGLGVFTEFATCCRKH